MGLNLKSKDSCKYDAVSLGEVLLRLDPGEGRIRTSRTFHAWEGGGEYNVIKGLRRCFRLNSAVLTAFADNEIGLLMEDLILQAGVDTSLIHWMPTNGTGSVCRNGLNFMERGFGLRGPVGCSDRFNTAISKATPEDLEIHKLFEEDGVRWFHTGGIYAALSEQSRDTLIQSIRVAKENGTVVSYDLNYRASIWSAEGGKELTLKINKQVVKEVDVLIGNEAEFSACLGIEAEANADPENDPLNIKGYEKVLRNLAAEYPNLKVITAILHTTTSASQTQLIALALVNGELYISKFLDHVSVLDSVGAGDAFGTGVIYGLMECNDPQKAIDYGVANAAFVMTTPGDTTTALKKELDALLDGTGGNIKR